MFLFHVLTTKPTASAEKGIWFNSTGTALKSLYSSARLKKCVFLQLPVPLHTFHFPEPLCDVMEVWKNIE